MLNRGYFITLAPEGTRSNRSISDRWFLEGTATLVEMSQLPVVPVVLYGVDGVMKRGRLFPNARGVNGVISIGEPIYFKNSGLHPKQAREKIVNDIYTASMDMYGELVAANGPTAIAPMETLVE